MAFKPKKEQLFYLVPKHSEKENMVLAFDGATRGGSLKLKAFNAEDVLQQFCFHRGNSFCWIKPAKLDLYVSVASSSQDDRASIVAWDWMNGANHQRFEFIPAADGYYRIRARHSQKYLDVTNAEKAAGTVLQQHMLMTSENQLFKPVLVPEQPVGASLTSFKENSELVRTAVLGVIGLAPTVGGGLKFIVGYFWKADDKLAAIWEQMKSYVDTRIIEFIKAERLKIMGDELLGITNAIREIYDTEEGDGSKGRKLETVITSMNILEKKFFDGSDESVPYAVGFGTIFITLRHAMVHEYKQLYDKDPTAAVKAQNIALLKTEINKYTGHINKIRERMLKARNEKLSPEVEVNLGLGADEAIWEDNETKQREIAAVNNLPAAEEKAISENSSEVTAAVSTDELGERPPVSSRIRDRYDGWQQTWYNHTTNVDPNVYPDNKVRAAFALAERKKQAAVQYTAELDEYLSTSRFWKYFNPDEKTTYKPVKTDATVGAFGVVYAHNTFEGVKDSAITAVKFYWWDEEIVHGGVAPHLCGIEVFYGNKSDGIKGQKRQHESTLTLKDGDYITTAFGFAKNIVEGFWLGTNKGNLAGGGRMESTNTSRYIDDHDFFVADMPDTLSAKLVRISGAYNKETLDQLTFHWEYMY